MRPVQLTREDLTRTLGEIDDIVAAQILSIGATVSELETALRVVDRDTEDRRPATPSAHLAALVDVLREIADDNEPEYLGTD